MSNQAPQMKKTGPDEYETTDELIKTYNKSSVEQEVENLKNVIDKKEKQVGLKSLKQQLENKQALLDRMNQAT